MTIGNGLEILVWSSLAVLKAGMLFGAAMLLCKTAARRSPTLRHALWTLVILGAFVSLAPLAAGPSIVVPLPGERVLPPVPATLSPMVANEETPLIDVGTDHETQTIEFGVVMLLGWGIIAAVLLARLAWAHGSLRRFYRSETSDADERLRRRVVGIAGRLGARKVPRLRVSKDATAPHVSGVARPTIVLPSRWSSWPPATLEAILLHELAHVRRRDCLWNTLANVACAVAWFNPFLYVARRWQRRAAERCCDDAVLAGGVRASAYLESLVLVSRSTRTVASVGLVAMASSKSDLMRRAHRIADASDDPRPRRRARNAGVLFGFAIVLLAMMSVSVARVASVASPALGGDPDEPDAVRLERVLREADAGRVDARRIVEESAWFHADAAKQDALLRALSMEDFAIDSTVARFVEVGSGLRADAAVTKVFDSLFRRVRLPESLAIRMAQRVASMSADAAKEYVLLSLVRSQAMTPAVRAAVSRSARTIAVDASRSRVEAAIARG